MNKINNKLHSAKSFILKLFLSLYICCVLTAIYKAEFSWDEPYNWDTCYRIP